jgi:hypothetical protein
MKMMFYLVAMFVACYWAGYLLTSAKKARNGLPRHFRLQIGYAYYLLAFYLSYIYVKDISLATLITVAFPAGFYVCRKLFPAKRAAPDNGSPQDKYEGRKCLLVLIALFCLAGWPYLATGWGNYWHNGNEDIEDGLSGRDAYVNHQIFNERPFLMEQITGDSAWEDFAQKANIPQFLIHEKNTYYLWYASGGFRLQYSNLAFWSLLLNQKHGMDIAIVHAIFDLILMALGIYSLAYIVFQLSSSWSAIAAFSAVAGSFYLGTFWAGHIGSLMYGAIAPMLATFVLASKSRSDWKTVAFGMALGTGAMLFTYPQALLLGMAYWLGFRIYASGPMQHCIDRTRDSLRRGIGRKVTLILVGLVVISIIAYLAWRGTGNYRIRQEGQYRAWGLTRDLSITSLFFGYLPDSADLRISYAFYRNVGIISSILLLICTAFYTGVQKHFVRFFTLTWIVGLLFFYICIQDSYYLYKYLYTHQFVFVVALCAFCAASGRTVVRLLGGGLLAINVRSDLIAADQIFQMPFNGRSTEYSQLASVKKDILEAAFIDLSGGEGVAVRETFKSHRIKTEVNPRLAKYFILRKGNGGDIAGEQLGEVVFNNDFLEIRNLPERNYLMVRSYFEPEIYPPDPLLGPMPFRWVGDGKNDNVGIYIVRPDHKTDSALPFLRICAQKGPSAVGAIALNIMTGDHKMLGQLSLDGTNCTWLRSEVVKDAVQPLILRAGSLGTKLSPPEDRTLLYRIFSLAWVNQRYDEKSLAVLNPGDDKLITPPKSPLKFGNGWWPPETFKEEHFRWASDGAEIVIPAECSGRVRISLELQTGPSHGQAPGTFSVSDNLGKVIFTTPMSSVRQNVEFTVSQSGSYRLSTGSERKQIAADYRILDFRVLKLAVDGC